LQSDDSGAVEAGVVASTRQDPRARAGLLLLVVVAALFVLTVLPVILKGEPLRDDFDLCISDRWNSGITRIISERWAEEGIVRLFAKAGEASYVATLCGAVPFWVLLVLPLTLTLVVAVLLRLLLIDLHGDHPWPEIGATVWLLQPLGTEAALWPSALHIPLGLALAIVALRFYRRGRVAWAVAATLAAANTLEQVIFALPFITWLLTPPVRRRRMTLVCSAVVGIVLLAYLRWPGAGGRTAVAFTDRLAAVVSDPTWYLEFPAIGLGLHSVPLAIGWAFPLSLGILATGLIAGVVASRVLFGAPPPSVSALRPIPIRRSLIVLAVLLLLVNVPLIATLPREDSPRTFTPTWLILAALVAIVGSRVGWRRVHLAGMTFGVFAACALLSIALSVSVRTRTADFTEASSRWLAQRVDEGESVLVCDVPRTVVTPAPAGTFALHEFHHTWAAEAALQYYTGIRASIDRVGVYWPGACRRSEGEDLLVQFSELPMR
jgi:hypothetical protein